MAILTAQPLPWLGKGTLQLEIKVVECVNTQ